LDMAPNDWDAEETYADVGEKLGMSLEEWTEFSAEIQALNGDVDALKGNMFGPTEQERGRLGIRISNENPDWTEEQVNAEADRLLEEKWMTSEAYAEAAAAETALFQKYNIRKENPGVYGSGIWIDEDGKYHKFESSSGNLYQTSQDTSFLDVAVPIGIALGASLITAGGVGTMLGSGMNGILAGAIQGAAGSAAGQGVMGGGIDPKKLLQAAMLGGLGSIVDNLARMDGSIMDNAIMGGADSAVSQVSDMLNIGYDQALDLVSGVIEGTIHGGDLEDIVGGAIVNLGTGQIQDMLTGAFGDTLDVDDWFKDGASHIPMEAFEPVIKGTLEAAIAGGMDAEDAVKMIWGYFDNGGDVDFMLPGFKDMVDGWEIPGLDFEKGGWGMSYDEESGDWVINHELPDLPDIDVPDIDLPDIDLDVPKPECLGDESWDELLGKCMPNIDLPDVDIDVDLPDIGAIYCTAEQEEMGWSWDSFKEQCLPPIEGPDVDVDLPEVSPLYCTEEQKAMGWSWDSFKDQCLPPLEGPDVDVDVPTPDPIYCTEEQKAMGWSWDSFKEQCLPETEGPDVDGPDVDVDLPDIDIPNPCGEGSFLDEAGICQPDVSLAGGNANPHDFTAQSLFDYTNIDVYQGAKLEPWKGAIKTVKGMLS
jgi:hypothetical protein